MTGLKALCGAAVALLAVHGSSHAQSSQDWEQVIAAAKKEGSLVLYSGVPGVRETPVVAKLFEAKYGIKVDVLEARGTEIQERVRTELVTGRNVGDLSLTGGTTQFLYKNQGLLQVHPGIPNLGRLAITPGMDEEVPVYVNTYGLAVSTILVPQDQEPKSWLDLLDPKWKGKFLSDEMTTSGTGATWYGVMQDAFGNQFHERMAKQALTYARDVRESPRRVARREFAMYIPYPMADHKNNEGLPLKAIVPTEGLAYTPITIALIKNAPHPNAARLYMSFYLDNEAQLVYATTGYRVSTNGMEAQTPEKFRWLATAKLLGRQKLEGQQERMREADKIYNGR